MKSVWKFAFTVLLALFITSAYAQESGEFTVPFSTPGSKGKVKIDIKKGSVEVRGTARKDVLLKYTSMENDTKSATNEEGLKRIPGAALDLEVSEQNNYIRIESDSWNKGVNLVIEVPSTIDLHVETYNSGDIFIANITGEIDADNYNGTITAENISGSLVANTFNGTIKATFLKITPDTPMAFSTYNGDVDLTLPASFKASMKMKTKQGEILSGFDFVVRKNEPVTKTEDKSKGTKVYIDDWVRAEINGGGPEFTIQNYNGNIYLRKG